MTLDDNIMYKAAIEKDKSFEGIFFIAVKTTGIFCRPTCPARKPKKENVEFFYTSNDALMHGYRPCKVCSPMVKPGETPDYIKEIIKEINNNASVKIKDESLREKGIEPNRVRRWFKKNHGITFQTFQRMMRMNNAFNKIHNGEKVTHAAFDSGYDSLSGFNDSFKSIVGGSPTKSRTKKVINITRLETPLGPMFAAADDQGICLLEFTDRRMLETELKDLTKHMEAVVLPGENGHIEQIKRELEEYFEGKRRNFTVSLSIAGTEFQKRVWNRLKRIPYGKTISYKDEADSINSPAAVRAVANANGHNRISIVIPCHRVIGNDGSLTGYGGGLWRKKWLLDFEKECLKK